MPCDCQSKIDERLKEKNLKLACYSFVWHETGPMDPVPTIATEWIDRDKATRGNKNSPTTVFARYCPFCGEPVDPKQEVDGKREQAESDRIRRKIAAATIEASYLESPVEVLPTWERVMKVLFDLYRDKLRLDWLSNPKNKFNYLLKADGRCELQSCFHGQQFANLRDAIDQAKAKKA